jgi:hypothetical protein
MWFSDWCQHSSASSRADWRACWNWVAPSESGGVCDNPALNSGEVAPAANTAPRYYVYSNHDVVRIASAIQGSASVVTLAMSIWTIDRDPREMVSVRPRTATREHHGTAAEAALRQAIGAEPGYALGRFNLGVLKGRRAHAICCRPRGIRDGVRARSDVEASTS